MIRRRFVMIVVLIGYTGYAPLPGDYPDEAACVRDMKRINHNAEKLFGLGDSYFALLCRPADHR